MDGLIKETIRIALLEDIGSGDVTSSIVIPDDIQSRAHIIAKDDFVLAGMPFVKEVFNSIDPNIAIKIFFGEGSNIKNGDVIAEINGNLRGLLAGERVSLNILQHVSGIATLTKEFVERVKGLHVRITDTRKTIPAMRIMEKYGVRMGGGYNHRFGLSDGVLIKDNHIKAAGGIKEAVARAMTAHHLLKIEVEVKTLSELEEALNASPDVIMLDNLSLDDMRKAVIMRNARCESLNTKIILEASGGVNLENVRGIAETSVDIISVGALTHSARAVDISMKIIDA